MTVTHIVEKTTTRAYTFGIKEIVDILKDHISENGCIPLDHESWDGVELNLVFLGEYESILDRKGVEAVQLVTTWKSGEKRTE